MKFANKESIKYQLSIKNDIESSRSKKRRVEREINSFYEYKLYKILSHDWWLIFTLEEKSEIYNDYVRQLFLYSSNSKISNSEFALNKIKDKIEVYKNKNKNLYRNIRIESIFKSL